MMQVCVISKQTAQIKQMTNEMTDFESCSVTDDKSVYVKKEDSIFSSKNLSSDLKAAESVAVDVKVKNELQSEEAEAFVTYQDPPFSTAADDKREIKAERVETFPGDLISPTENTSHCVSSSNFIDSSVIVKKEEDLEICFLEDERSVSLNFNSCAVSESREADHGRDEAHSPSKRNQETYEISKNEALSQIPTVSSVKAEASKCEESAGLQAAPQVPSDSFQCVECGVSYRSKRLLKLHLSSCHGKKFLCNHCAAAFSSLKEWTVHETSHSNKELFLCVRCKATFKDQDHLTQHWKVHLDEGQFSCRYCPAVFSGILEIYQHLHLHLSERTCSAERNYSCGQCPTTFRSKSQLKLHLVSHSRGQSISCVYCAATFKNKGALYSHMRVHAYQHGKKR